VSIDTAPGRTTRAADEAIMLRPEALAAFVCAVAVAAGADEVGAALGESDLAAICDRAGLSREEVESLAGRITGADEPGFVVSASLGRYSHAAAVIAGVQALVSACDGSAWILPLCMNAFALPGLASSLDLRPPVDVRKAVEGSEVDALVVVGFDPGSIFPEEIWRPWLERPKLVAWAGSLSCAFAEAADIAIPLALAWEESGTMVCRDGSPGHFGRWAPPPGNVPTVQELMGMLAGGMGAKELEPLEAAEAIGTAAAGPSLGDPIGPGVLDVAEAAEGCVTVVGAPEPQGYTGGLDLAGAPWQARMAAEEAAVCPVAAEGWITLGEPPGIAVACRPPGHGQHEKEWTSPVAAVPAHWPAARELLDWQVSPGGDLVPEPRAVPLVEDE
jgi:hypothetical protein